MKRRTPQLIRVFRSPLDRRRGRVVGAGLDYACALGRSGTTRMKREGDGATPVGRFRILRASYRPDRLSRPQSPLHFVALRPDDGWCDDAGDRRYNRPVRLPYAAGHERMWREDRLYDVVLDLSYNRAPTVRGRGSAIFLHVAQPGLAPTQGCIALDPRRIRHLVGRIGPGTIIAVVG